LFRVIVAAVPSTVSVSVLLSSSMVVSATPEPET
jgi:hypothetical protein